MNKPDFTLGNWQRQRINEYIFVRSEQAAFDQITHDIQTDVELLVAGLAIGMMIEDDGPSVLTYFHEELGSSSMVKRLHELHGKLFQRRRKIEVWP